MDFLIAMLLGGVLVVSLLLWRAIHSMASSVAQTTAHSSSLAEAATVMRERLAEVHAWVRAREQMDRSTFESIRRLETVIAGTRSKGAAAENIVEAVFGTLPPEWQVRDFRVGNKVVEFGLRLPNHLVLPIDSKWPATHLVEQLLASEDGPERLKLKGQIEDVVLAKAREVRKYVDPGLTTGFGIAVVPDSVYDLCSGIQAEVFRLNVVLIGYSLFVPYLLLVFETVLKTSQNVDLEKLDAYLRAAEESVQALQDELEGRFARALAMLTNSRSDMSHHVSRVGTRLASLRTAGDGKARDPQVNADER